jgi:hypothetical protein
MLSWIKGCYPGFGGAILDLGVLSWIWGCYPGFGGAIPDLGVLFQGVIPDFLFKGCHPGFIPEFRGCLPGGGPTQKEQIYPIRHKLFPSF